MLTLRGRFHRPDPARQIQAIWARESGGGGGGRRGAGEMAAADCGICVPAGDAAGLAAALKTVASHPEEYREKGRRGRLYFERNFTRERFMERLDELLRQLTGGKAGTR